MKSADAPRECRLVLPSAASLPTEGTFGDGPLPPIHPNVFGSGPKNAAGPRMIHYRDQDVIRATFVFDHRYEGGLGLVHGGVTAAVLDDILGGVLIVLKRRAVTAQLEVSYFAPIPIDDEVQVEGWLESIDGRKIKLVSRVLDEGQTMAIARCLLIEVPRDYFPIVEA